MATKSTSAGKSAALGKSAAKAKGTGTQAKARTAPPRRAAQMQPTPDRYREIQQALADRGYFDGPVDGNWGPQSVDALKRFQHNESLDEDGKIGSLALIKLGLGPQRAYVQPGSQPVPAEPNPAAPAASPSAPPESNSLPTEPQR
jgi:peptidoglycan hydrolase-like protein with peptidoglycan-binding domain